MKADSFSMRLAAVTASLGLLSFGVAALVGSLSQAHAQSLGPEVTGGTQPYVSFSGSASAATTTLYTVPSDRILVVTAAMMNGYASLYQDGTVKVKNSSYAMYMSSGASPWAPPTALITGTARVVFDPGTTLVIGDVSGPAVGYLIQGYLAHP